MAAKKKTEDDATTATTVEDRIKALVSALGHDPAHVSGVEVAGKRIRVIGKDRSLRSHSIGEWNVGD